MAGFLGGWNTGSGGLLNAQQPISGLLGVQQALTPLSDANNAFQQQQFHNLAQLPPQFRVSPQDWGTLMGLGGPIAYHGSPYSFNAFDASKIGTGEGAQAYGHGLYFAENPGVAANYRDTLAPANTKWMEGDRVLSGAEQNAAELLDRTGGDVDKARAHIKYALRPMRMADQNYLDATEAALGHLNPAAIRVAQDPGNLYKVDIQPDPEQFLDWDKPLSEQSPHVQQALRSSGLVPEGANWTGQEVHTAASKGGVAYVQPDRARAATALQQAGIPGIRYLDQGSRGAGEGTHNYVVFDPAHVNILEHNGQPIK